MAPECPGWFFWGAQSIDLYYYNGTNRTKDIFFLVERDARKSIEKRVNYTLMLNAGPELLNPLLYFF